MRRTFTLTLVAVLIFGSASLVLAQGRRGGGFGRGGAGVSRLALANLEPVQKELELVPEQLKQIRELRDELRGDRGQRGQRGDRRNFQDLSDEERQELAQQRRKAAEERAKKETEKLAEILLDNQSQRLDQIYIQVLGAAALQDEDVKKKLSISDQQWEKLASAQAESQRNIRQETRELFQSGGDRDGIREKLAEIRKKNEEKLLALLSDSQKEQFEELKGEPFELPPDALRGRFGGRGGPAGGQRPGRDRPRRPE